MKLAVLGAGAWGTALAISLGKQHHVSLWARAPESAAELAATRINQRYLPGYLLPDAVRVSSELEACIAECEAVILTVPVSALRSVLEQVRAAEAALIIACKGLERTSALLPHEVVTSSLGVRQTCVLSGPSFAQEVARDLPAAVVLASADTDFARRMARELHGSRLRIYSSNDLVGVEIAGAAKNVMAIATGICDGLGLGLNARAALITRGLAEIARLGSRLGGRTETFLGLAGAGDLILTCTGDLSRNRTVGLRLATGAALVDILSSLGHVAEGVSTAYEVQRLAVRLGVEMPITAAVCQVLEGQLSPALAVSQLMERDAKAEF